MFGQDGTESSGRRKHHRDNAESRLAGNFGYEAGVGLTTIVLRGAVEIESPLELVLEFLSSYPLRASDGPATGASFDESDLRRANRGGARISAVQIAAILERRVEIEAALSDIDPGTSLRDPTRSLPWVPLTRLFDAFADIPGVGFSKTTKALHPKRPELIPMLDSVVQAYLAEGEHATTSAATFGEHATALVRSFKRDVDRNGSALRQMRRELAGRGFRLTEVRILDVLIWSAFADR